MQSKKISISAHAARYEEVEISQIAGLILALQALIETKRKSTIDALRQQIEKLENNEIEAEPMHEIESTADVIKKTKRGKKKQTEPTEE